MIAPYSYFSSAKDVVEMKETVTTIKPTTIYVAMSLPCGYYSSVKDVVDAMNACIVKTLSQPFWLKFEHTDGTDKAPTNRQIENAKTNVQRIES